MAGEDGGAGISGEQLDTLIWDSNQDLAARGFWWVYTLTDPVAKVVDGALIRLRCDGYSGEVYHRNAFLYLGQTAKAPLEGWLIDGKPYHIRQGAVTLTHSNVPNIFPMRRRFVPLGAARSSAGQPFSPKRSANGVNASCSCAIARSPGRR